MFCLIYRFVVKPGEEERFDKAWSEVTEAFKKYAGALGSRLHKTDDGKYIAYAQWPSRESREAAELPQSIQDSSWTVMRSCCEQVEVLFELTPVADLLELVGAIDS